MKCREHGLKTLFELRKSFFETVVFSVELVVDLKYEKEDYRKSKEIQLQKENIDSKTKIKTKYAVNRNDAQEAQRLSIMRARAASRLPSCAPYFCKNALSNKWMWVCVTMRVALVNIDMVQRFAALILLLGPSAAYP